MGRPSKRTKYDDFAPSKNLMVTDIPSHVEDKDLVILFSKFGEVVDLVRISAGRCCFVEFTDMEVAVGMVQQAKEQTFYIIQQPVNIGFANSPHIVRKVGVPNSTKRVEGMIRQASQQQPMFNVPHSPNQVNGGHLLQLSQPSQIQGLPGRILIFNITNCVYPITVNVLNSICSAVGKVLKISIGAKQANNSLEALVEFATVSEANNAVKELDGADIYNNCCSLSVTVSHLAFLQIYKNDEESFDFTNPNPGAVVPAQPKTGLLGVAPSSQPMQMMPPQQQYNQPHSSSNKLSFDKQQNNFQPFENTLGRCLWLNNLPPDCLNCTHIFNLFCIYGNVVGVKFLKSKECTAMVEMGLRDQAESARNFLNKLPVKGFTVEVTIGKQQHVDIHPNPMPMFDGTPLSQDFTGSAHNRFLDLVFIQRARFIHPCSTLHFFNAPAEITEQQLAKIFMELGANSPTKIVKFSIHKKGNKPSLGLIDFANVEDAILGVMKANNHDIQVGRNKKMMNLKLSFSIKAIDDEDYDAVEFNNDGEAIGTVGERLAALSESKSQEKVNANDCGSDKIGVNKKNY